MSTRLERIRKRIGTSHYQQLYMGDSYCSFYHDRCKWDYHKLADNEGERHAIFLKDRELLLRYQRYCHFVKEILPEWKQVKEIHYADNSTEVLEENKWGDTRYRMTVAPSGDVCF